MAKEYASVKCELCGSAMRTGGQLWTGPFHDREFVKKMLGYDPDRQCKKVLDAATEEANEIPYYFRADEISAKLRTNPHSVQKIIEKLQSAGFVASKASLNTGAFKTDARIDQILGVLK
jgi:tRNA (guanine26-N2/guanine27-N2)-dimethyltransferase